MNGLRQGRRWGAVPALLLLLALWLFVHPWQGLWHDGRLYAVQALRRLLPANFAHDLFFLHGSQDAFTLFSLPYAAAIDALGLERAALLVQALGSTLWLAGAAFLLAAFLRGLPFWLGMLLLSALPADYGPIKFLFNLAEPFPTPRIFAEALSMLAIGCALRGHWRRSLPLLLLAGVLHPLMALGPLLFGVLFMAEGRLRALAALAAAGALLLGLLATLGVPPFARVLVSMDAAWLAQVSQLVPVATWDAWQTPEWLGRTVLAFSLVLTAARLAQGARARFFYCAALAGAGGLLASWLGTGMAHNLLLIQTQPWRALWLTQLASGVALAWLLATFWQRGGLLRALLLALCAAILVRNSYGGALGALAGLLLCQQARSAAPLQLARRHYLMALAAVGALAAGSVADALAGPLRTGIYLGDIADATIETLWLWAWLKQGGAALLGALLLLLVWRGAGSARLPVRVGAWLLAVAVLGASVQLALQRAHDTRLISEAGQAAVRAAFLPLIPPSAVVYWEEDVRFSWFVLQRSNYASSTQMGGTAFERGTAIEGPRRLARLLHLGVRDAVRAQNRYDNLMQMSSLPAPGKAGLAYACADPVLDFVVLDAHLGAGEVARAIDHQAGQSWILYDCDRLRAPETK